MTCNGSCTRKASDSPACSRLRRVEPDALHDVICVGFGPASLAIAVALEDALDSAAPTRTLYRGSSPPRLAFLERQPEFAWHSGMLLPSARMQISFVKDLATLRNPRSEFTFLNYLHAKERLVQFTNLATFLPLRLEYEDYMRWCASAFDDVVAYGQEVVSVVPQRAAAGKGKVDSFRVTSKDVRSGHMTTRQCRHVIVAIGGKPSMPSSLPSDHPRVVHSSRYSTAIPKLLPDRETPYKIAVVGNGQSAAEIFHDLQSRFPRAETTLIIKGSALRPSDDSPFVNEIFDPDRVDQVYNLPQGVREAAIAQDRGTNYGVVRLELLQQIYADLYTQRLKEANGTRWQHRILANRIVDEVTDSTICSGVRLHLRDTDQSGTQSALDVDLLLVATGYERHAHEEILQGATHLRRPEDDRWRVARDYRVMLDPDKVEATAGIWLQGCNESTHGLSDTLLSILATRAGELVASIFGHD